MCYPTAVQLLLCLFMFPRWCPVVMYTSVLFHSPCTFYIFQNRCCVHCMLVFSGPAVTCTFLHICCCLHIVFQVIYCVQVFGTAVACTFSQIAVLYKVFKQLLVYSLFQTAVVYNQSLYFPNTTRRFYSLVANALSLFNTLA